MGFAHFHLFSRYNPDSPVQIEFPPFGAAQFAGAHKQVWCQLQRQTGERLARIAVNGAQQLTNRLRLQDCAMVRYLGGHQRSAQ